MSFDTVVFDPPTEPITLRPMAVRVPQPSPAALWVRAHGVYVALAVVVAFCCMLSPLPRFESTLTGIAVVNTILWVLRKIGGRA